MEKLLPMFALLLLMACNYQVEKGSETVSEEDESTLRTLHTVLWTQAYSEQDTSLLNQLLHENFQLIDDNGDKYSKADEMTYVAENGPSYDEFEFEVNRIDIFDNGTAMIYGTGIMKGVEGAEAYITKYQSSTALVKEKGAWRAISSHVSGVKEETFPLAED
jgi:hypothetical protein